MKTAQQLQTSTWIIESSTRVVTLIDNDPERILQRSCALVAGAALVTVREIATITETIIATDL